MSLRTPIGRVIGRGTAHDGLHHWWVQRVTSIALVPLTLWFVFALLGLPLADHAAVIAWISRPWNTVLLTLLVVVMAHHSRLGVQVVIEDYVHGHGTKMVALLASSFAHAVVAVASVYAVLRIGFGSVA